jgi:alanyl-tRNA synthetase
VIPERIVTQRLYYDDPLRLSFDACVVRNASWEGAPSVVLDRTAFYPEAGGQMADRGLLGGHPVTDVQVDDAGVIHHILDLREGASPLLSMGAPPPKPRSGLVTIGAPPPNPRSGLGVGDAVTGSVDRARRRAYMALHTAQHMLSRALADVAMADTVSSRLGESACTIDLDRETLEERAVAEAEDLVNAVIDDDVPIRAYFPTAEELASLPLRRAPKVTGDVRVVVVGAFDVTPCGGTHCTRSAQVGFLRVTGIERYKGKARVTFSAGPRGRGELWREASVLRDLGRAFTCGPFDVPLGVEKLRRELGEARDTLGLVRGRLADAIGAELCEAARATGRAVAVLDDAGPDLLRALATRITTAAPAAVAFLAGRGSEGLAVLVARGAASTLDCGAFLKRAATEAAGRGGGRPERAEGRLPRDADWAALVARLAAA